MFSLRFFKIANHSSSVHNSILQPHENVKTQQHIYTQNTHTYAHDVVWNYNARSIWMYEDVLGWFNVVFLHGVPIRNSVNFKARGTHTRDTPTYARLLKKFVHSVDASLKYVFSCFTIAALPHWLGVLCRDTNGALRFLFRYTLIY